MTTTIVITPDGVVRMLHDDALAALYSEGETTLRRASHVEPTDDARWTADMSPVDGPTLGPCATRGEALALESAWLADRLHSL